MSTNGTAPQGAPVARQPGETLKRARATREQVVGSVRTLLEDEERKYQRLRDQVEEARQRMDHLRKALDHLLAEPGQAAPAKAKVQTQPRQRADGTVFRPRQQYLDQVVEALRDGPLTNAQILERVSFSHDVVRRAIAVLREEERVRRAGRTGKTGRAHVYALMPERPADA
jgi:CHASE3 domain sensor protein